MIHDKFPPMQMQENGNGSAVRGMREQAALAGEPEPTTYQEVETPYLPNYASEDAHTRWESIQAEFVDDPRRSVADARQLVGDLTQRIVDAFTHERDTLERQWTAGQEVSTEDLRQCLQRYRAFFARLLPAMPEGKS